MSNRIPWLFAALVLWIGMGMYLHQVNCCFSAILSAPLTISDGTTPVATAPDNLTFTLNGARTELPVSVENAYADMTTYLNNNPNKTLTLTGEYLASEINSTAFDNLGIARAESLKKYFINKGIDAERTFTDGILVGELKNDGKKVIGAMNYAFGEAPPVDDRLTRIEAAMAANPITVLYYTDRSKTELETGQEERLDDLLYYLTERPETTLTITGHADYRGSLTYNQRLGLRRAKFIRDHLIRNGIARDRLTVRSMGETSPIASNKTEAGMAQNRRAVVEFGDK